MVKQIGWGAIIRIDSTLTSTSGDAPTTSDILEAKIIGSFDFGASRDRVEVTDFESPNQFREYIAGLKEQKPLNLVVHYDPSQHQPASENFSPFMENDLLGIGILFRIITSGNTDKAAVWGDGFVIDQTNTVVIDQPNTLALTISPDGEWTTDPEAL